MKPSRKRPRCAREVTAILKAAPGFELRNGKGAHVVCRCPDGRSIVYTDHPGDLSPGLRAHLCRELVRYGLLAVVVLAVVAWLA